jgi:ubiquinol-cytochrome c reductase cytochrome c1 subunit
MNPARARLLAAAAFLGLLLPLAASLHASEGSKLQRAPVNMDDTVSLQRGARIFVNYCLNCHSAAYMRFNRLRDLGLTDDQIRENLIFTGVKVGSPMTVAMVKRDADEWFNIPTPDITVIARSRSSEAGSGADWLYSYLRAFHRDDSRPTGWNNLVYENSSMPHIFWQQDGQHQVKVQEFASRHEAHAALLQAGSVARVDEVTSRDASGNDSKRWVLKSLERASDGTLTAVEYDQMVADLVNYMLYMAEPARLKRHEAGVYALLLLAAWFVLAYLLKREYWKDVH